MTALDILIRTRKMMAIAAAALLLCAPLSFAQNYAPPAGSALARKVHPRLYLTAEQLPGLRARLLNLYKNELQNYVHALDAAFDEAPSSKTRNMILMDAHNYAFLYLIDSAQMPGITFAHTRLQYGRKAIDHAFAARNLSGSARGDTHISARLQSTEGAHHNLAIAVVYDWTFPLLTLDEKRLLAEALIQLYSERDEDANPDLYPKLSNQVTGYIHHGCAAALAIWGDDLGAAYTGKAQELLNYFNAVFLERTLISGDRIFEGPGWGEGANYYFLGMTNVSFLAGAAGSALGKNLFFETDFLRRNALCILYNTLPLKQRDNYYMSRHDTNSLRRVLDADMSRLLALAAGSLRTADPNMAGLAKWMITSGGFGLDVRQYQSYSPRVDDLFFHFIWGYKDVPAKSPQELGLPLGLKLGLGETVMKSSFDKETSTHVIFWTPRYWYFPHAAKDIASFTIYKHGSLALDGGNEKNEDDLPRGDGAGEVVFHNVLGLYDPNEDDKGFRFMDFDFSADTGADHWQHPAFKEGGQNHVGNLQGFDHTAEYDYADYNYTRVYSQERCSFARRRLAYLRGPENQEFVVVHDLVDSPQQKRFLLHTAYEPLINNDVVTVTNRHERAHGRMFVKSVLPAAKEIVKIGGEGKWFVDADGKVLSSRGPYTDWGAYWVGSYRLEIRSAANEFLTVMQLGDANALNTMASVAAVPANNLSGALLGGSRLILVGRTQNPLTNAQYALHANTVVSHLIAGLTPNAAAKISKNGVRLATAKTSQAGALYFKDNPAGAANYAIILEPVAVEENAPNIPESFALGQNFPNPFSQKERTGTAQPTAIEYDLRESSEVSFEIFDLTGKVVRTLLEQNQPAGRYRVMWDGRTQEGRAAPAGVYFYRLHSPQFTSTKKLVLLR